MQPQSTQDRCAHHSCGSHVYQACRPTYMPLQQKHCHSASRWCSMREPRVLLLQLLAT